MRLRRFHRPTVPVALLTVIGLFPGLAKAHTTTRGDANDTRGPLDIASITVNHDASDARYRFKTFTKWPRSALLEASYLLIAIDRDEDLVADRCLFIYSYGGALRGALTNCGRRNLGVMQVSKPSGTTATITTGISTLGGTHLWAAYSFYEREDTPCSKGCLDAVPNRQPLLHDLVPPTPVWTTTTTSPYFSTQLSTTTTVPVEFDLADADTQVTDWRIDRLENTFTGTWSTFMTGSASTGVVDLNVSQGETYLLRISATDLHGNFGTSLNYLRFAVPYDDANELMGYEGSWTATPNASYFEGGYHSTATVGDTLTFTFTSSGLLGSTTVYLLGGPGNGTATWTDGTSSDSISETPSTPVGDRVSGFSYTSGGTHTMTLTVDSGTIIVDGIAVVMD